MTTERSSLESGDMYSTAFQFYSHIQASVDPRTGMYTASVDLTTGEGNRLRGPHFGFRLSYSPMGTIDDGFGTGWRLSVTELDLTAGMLSLSTGDTHKVENLQTGAMAWFPDRKLDSCSLKTVSLSPPQAVVEHITGQIEYLAVPNAIGNVLRTERIVQADGGALSLEWSLLSGGSRLTKVVDDDGVTLLEVDYANPTRPRLMIHTHQDEPLTMLFSLVGGRLATIAIPALQALNARALETSTDRRDDHAAARADDEAVWEFAYRAADGELMLLESVTTPDGTREDVIYDNQALVLPPGAPRSHMPAVSECKRWGLRRDEEGNEYEFLQRSTFAYDSFNRNNFYGYPAVARWADGSDQLLHLIGQNGFQYGSTETRYDATRLLSRIERTYNQFHLVTREKVTRGTVVEQVDTVYGIRDVAFEDQDTTFQLPHRVTTTVYDASQPDDTRVVQVTYAENRYDDMGNAVSLYDSRTGTTERSTYYPATGETEGDDVLCPADPLGKVRRLKSRTIESPREGDPVRTTRYRYVSLPVVRPAKGRNTSNERTYYVQVAQEVLSIDEGASHREIERVDKAYVDDGGPFHGSLRIDSRTQDGLTEARLYTYTLDEPAATVTTDTLHTTHDGIENTSSETVHLISGLTRRSTDASGNDTVYDYDLLGRLVSEVAIPDDPSYRVETRWDYLLTARDRWVRRTGVTGLPHRTWLDEQGHRIRHEEPLADRSLWTSEAAEYDAFGQVTSETRYDTLGAGRKLVLRTRYEYDDWGQCSRLISPDGSQTVSETTLVMDPDVHGDEVVTRTTQWQVYGNGVKTGWSATETDAAGRKRRTQTGIWSADGQRVPTATTCWTYDGLGRCISTIDPLGHETLQTWDDYDRLSTTTLPDGTVILRSYAPGHEDELMAKLDVRPGDGGETMTLGTREWDGQGRIVRETSGSLSTGYEYVPRQASAAAKRMPGKGRIEVTYDGRLREVLLSSVLKVNGKADSSLTTARYDKRLGLPSEVASIGHAMAIETDYLGRMTRQTIRIDGDQERFSEVEVSPGGRELRKTGTDKVVRKFDYDALGRLDYIEDTYVKDTYVKDTDVEETHVRITLSYDELSRLKTRLTLLNKDARSVLERRAYDSLGRIVLHAWEHGGGDEAPFRRRLELDWRADDKVRTKTWYDDRVGNNPVRTETMEYDARGRLVVHGITAASDEELPRDEMRAPYVKQTFVHDCIDNLVSVETELRTGGRNVTRYFYDPTDHDRLVGLSNSLEGYPGYGQALTLRYDANGNLVDDGMGRKLAWDDAGRLVSVTLDDGKTIVYQHGPDGTVSRITRDGTTTFRYREDGAVAFETSSVEERRYIRTRGGMVAETRIAGALRETWLLGVDPQGSVVTEWSATAFVENA